MAETVAMGAAAAETAVMGVAAAAAAAATAATATVACGSTQGTLQSARARAGIGWGSSLQLHLSSLELVATRRKYPPAELPETGNPTGSQEHTHDSNSHHFHAIGTPSCHWNFNASYQTVELRCNPCSKGLPRGLHFDVGAATSKVSSTHIDMA